MGWILPGMPGHDADAPVRGAAGANDEPSGASDVPMEGDITEFVEGNVEDVANGEIVSDVVGGSGLTPALPISNELTESGPSGAARRRATLQSDGAPPLAVVAHGPDIAADRYSRPHPAAV